MIIQAVLATYRQCAKTVVDMTCKHFGEPRRPSCDRARALIGVQTWVSAGLPDCLELALRELVASAWSLPGACTGRACRVCLELAWSWRLEGWKEGSGSFPRAAWGCLGGTPGELDASGANPPAAVLDARLGN